MTVSTAHLNGSASTTPAPAMALTAIADDSSCANSTKDGAGTIVTHTCGQGAHESARQHFGNQDLSRARGPRQAPRVEGAAPCFTAAPSAVYDFNEKRGAGSSHCLHRSCDKLPMSMVTLWKAVGRGVKGEGMGGCSLC